MARASSNSILDRLPPTQRKALIARMRMIPLPVGKVLTRPGEEPEHAHFMISGITSVVTFMEDGGAVEVGLIGKEGVVEAMHLLGSADAPTTSKYFHLALAEKLSNNLDAARAAIAKAQELGQKSGPLTPMERTRYQTLIEELK